MTRTRTMLITLIATLILVLIAWIMSISFPGNNIGFKDSAAAIAFIDGAAIVIERIIELFWTIIGGIWGTYFPLNIVNNQVKTMVNELDSSLMPIYQQARNAVEELSKAGKLTGDALANAKAEIDELEARFVEVKNLAPDNQRIQLLTAAASQHVSYLEQKYIPNLTKTIGVANIAIDGLQNFISSFKDNPGRRLISIYLGASLGVIIAGVFGLDVFQATLEIDPQNIKYPALHIIGTGFLMGLGSSPTHEVIRAIQEYKKNRKGENIAKPDLPSSP